MRYEPGLQRYFVDSRNGRYILCRYTIHHISRLSDSDFTFLIDLRILGPWVTMTMYLHRPVKAVATSSHGRTLGTLQVTTKHSNTTLQWPLSFHVRAKAERAIGLVVGLVGAAALLVPAAKL